MSLFVLDAIFFFEMYWCVHHYIKYGIKPDRARFYRKIIKGRVERYKVEFFFFFGITACSSCPDMIYSPYTQAVFP